MSGSERWVSGGAHKSDVYHVDPECRHLTCHNANVSIATQNRIDWHGLRPCTLCGGDDDE
jgi:hypothetical protein